MQERGRRIVLENARSFSGFCVFLYLVFAAGHFLSLPDPRAAKWMTILAVGSAGYFLGLWAVLRRVSVAAFWAHPLSLAVGSVVLSNCLAHLYLTAQPEQTVNIALVVIGYGCFVLSYFWWTTGVILTLVAWLAVASRLQVDYPFQHWGFALFSATVISAAVQWVRIRTYRELFDLHRINEERTAELETALREANLSRRRAQLVIDNAFDAILTLDTSGRVTDWNERAEFLLGRRPEELAKRPPVESLLEETCRPAFTALLLDPANLRLEGGVKRMHESSVLRGDGTVLPVEIAFGEALAGISTASTVCLRDISERRQALDVLEEASRAKSAFLATMSHELRTPLNAIIGYSEMVAEDLEDAGVGKFTQDLNRIHISGKHLLALVNDILDLSKIEAGRMTLLSETFDPKVNIQDVAQTVLPIARGNGNNLVWETGDQLGTLFADSVRFSQILLNLASNACKFTKNGKVEIQAWRETRAGGDWLLVDVVDNGPGLTKEETSRLFEPYSQAGAVTAKRLGGTGLGLVISRRFSRMMGGDIVVDSTPGKGSRFRLELPVNGSGASKDAASDDLVRLAHGLEQKRSRS